MFPLRMKKLNKEGFALGQDYLVIDKLLPHEFSDIHLLLVRLKNKKAITKLPNWRLHSENSQTKSLHRHSPFF